MIKSYNIMMGTSIENHGQAGIDLCTSPLMPKTATPPSAALFNYRPLTPAELAQYHDQGYLVLRSVLTPAGLRQMVDECMAAWHAEKGPYKPNASWLENALLTNIHHRSRTVRDYYFAGP